MEHAIEEVGFGLNSGLSVDSWDRPVKQFDKAAVFLKNLKI